MDKKELIELIIRLFFFDGTYPPLLIGMAVFFVAQCLCFISKKKFIRFAPVFCIFLLFVIAIVWGIYAEINRHEWNSFVMVFGLMTIKISAFAVGDLLSCIIYKIRIRIKEKQKAIKE